MTETKPCPCGSQKTLAACCLPVIRGERMAETAVELLRARYTAFVCGEVDFILSSHYSRTRHRVKRKDIEAWSKGSEWLGLEILEVEKGGPTDTSGTIVFRASYRSKGELNDHRERSQFQKEDGEWRFVDGEQLKHSPIRRETPKIGRNDPCPCGSGKKYKKCCGATTAA
jgi:SEC-C motif-containing protein